MPPFLVSLELKSYLAKLKGALFEKTIPYMYLDTEGKVTVGVGHNITDNNDLDQLIFFVRRLTRHHVIGGDTGVPLSKDRLGQQATEAEKKNDSDFLSKHKGLGKYAPEHLAKYTTLEMPSGEIEKLFESDLKKAIGKARAEFGIDFDTYPVQVQAAIIDIAFNVGSFASFRGHFVPAIKKKAWKEAAQHARRGKVNPARNQQVAAWLTTGAG
jgi:GH24 family phage-related lysozyme (muramidase)